ncbi:CG13653 [Drosophila busckii]|uniref:CG13653 n=1 Tax=Drosophila busckii TaxID=30019 RepID=A0A0M4EMV1_DROBS|nr:uncharacterized protein LOC108601466 [Drosophila busckii]ALC46840.1 CG13653 [Drosophila busckii]
MIANVLRVVLFLLLSSQHNCSGFYIRNSDKSLTNRAQDNAQHNDEWVGFQNTLGLTQEKVELLRSQKDQQGTKELLNRFIQENPKYLTVTTKKPQAKQSRDQFKLLFRALVNQLKGSKGMLKTSFNFELADRRPLKPLKRTRRKIAVKMVSDMSSERVDDLLKMFYEKNNLQSFDYPQGDESEYDDAEVPALPPMDSDVNSDYAYDNLYDDEGDVDLTAKSRQNLEYGSFQDLIMQAKQNQWELEDEETKLHSPDNDHFLS